MKKAVFITNPTAPGTSYENGWRRERSINTREQQLGRGEGLSIFRCEFDTPARMMSAVVRATALGIFDLFVNGMRVGVQMDDGFRYDELKPEWTDYHHRIFEYEYDLTPFCIGREHHTLIAVVSPGWWSGSISFCEYSKTGKTAFCGEIEITGADGRTQLIASDATWQTAMGGCIRTADIWDGEYYDAREPDPSFSPEAYDWTAAVPFDEFTGVIEPFVGDPLRVRRALARYPISAVLHEGTVEDGSAHGAICVLETKLGRGCEAITLKKGQKLILDMGQNMVGRPKISISGAASGTTITGLFAELLNDSGDPARGSDGPRGSLYVANYRWALSRMVYVAAGRGTETYEPTHTYYGFRYLELSADGDVEIRGVEGRVVGSDIRETGWIETDNPMVNQLFSNIVWGMRGNYFSNPTDCPQRDERLGWTGDTQIFCGAGAYIADTRAFMHKWLGDVRCCQLSHNGEVGDVIPAVSIVGRNAAAWGDAAVTVPYKMWLMFNDEALLAEHYEAMEAYMHSLEQYGLEGPKPTYGDWLSYEKTDPKYIGMAYYAHDAALMERFSNVLSRYETKYVDRAAYYHLLRRKIVRHFRETYLDENGDLTQNSQTGYLLALSFDLVEEKAKPRLRAQLRQKIVENGYRLSTGFVGTGVLNQTLGEHDMNDLAYALLLQTEDPSWLYSVRQGATTVWERWNSYTVERGFGDVGMNSFNHYAYGAVAEWMFGYMAGIRPDPVHPGFEHFILAPKPDNRAAEEIPAGQTPIRRVKAHYDTTYGTIESAWEYVENLLHCSFTIPTDTTAAVIFPTREGTARIKINDCLMDAASLGATVDAEGWHFTLTAGQYDIAECETV